MRRPESENEGTAVGFAVVRSYPISVESDAHGGRSDKIYKKVNQRFAWFRLTNRMFLVRRLHIEHLAAQAASSGSSRGCGVILR